MNQIRKLVDDLCAQGDFIRAIETAMKSWRRAESQYGENHPVTAESMIILADAAAGAKNHHLARAFYTRALAVQEVALGPSHPDLEYSRSALKILDENAES
ncbi:MAG: tetratricopeptide repeat protein [Pseudomonadota bacterium]